MAKVKSHAKWNGLTKKQREMLEEWLFEEKMGFAKAWERAKKELGFTGSVSSLRRYYGRTQEERMLAGFAESARVMASVNKAPVDAEGLRDSGMKVAAQVFFRLVREKTGGIEGAAAAGEVAGAVREERLVAGGEGRGE